MVVTADTAKTVPVTAAAASTILDFVVDMDMLIREEKIGNFAKNFRFSV